MSKKIITIGLIVFFITGCQLAKVDDGYGGKDRLIGVYITFEPIVKGSNVTIYEEKFNFNNEKIYGELIPESPNSSPLKYYDFPDLDGMIFVSPHGTNDEYIINNFHEGINKPSINYSDDNITLKGEVYLANNANDSIILNPVYLDKNNEVYFIPSISNYSFAGEEGRYLTTSLSENFTTTENGIKKEESFTVEISIGVKNTTEQLSIIEMSEEHQLISMNTYTIDEIPTSIKKFEKNNYIIVEKINQDKLDRDIYDGLEDEYITYNIEQNGICLEKNIPIEN